MSESTILLQLSVFRVAPHTPLNSRFSHFVPKALTIQESEMFGASFPDASFVKTLHSSSKPLLFSVALHMTQHKYLSTDQQTNHVVDTIHTN